MEHVAERLSEVLECPKEAVIEATNANARLLFGLK
jgi:Tat protein secretion system quality control protein TatD with DNase activity